MEKIDYKKWECIKNNVLQKEYIAGIYKIKLDRPSRNKLFSVVLLKINNKNLDEIIKYGVGLRFFYQLIKFLDTGCWSENITKYKLR